MTIALKPPAARISGGSIGDQGEIQAQQQAEQHAVVAEQSGLAISLGVVAPLCGEQTGDGTEQRTGEQHRRGQQDRQQAQQAAQRMALEEYLTETVEQSLGPVGAVGVEVIGRHGMSFDTDRSHALRGNAS